MTKNSSIALFGSRPNCLSSEMNRLSFRRACQFAFHHVPKPVLPEGIFSAGCEPLAVVLGLLNRPTTRKYANHRCVQDRTPSTTRSASLARRCGIQRCRASFWHFLSRLRCRRQHVRRRCNIGIHRRPWHLQILLPHKKQLHLPRLSYPEAQACKLRFRGSTR